MFECNSSKYEYVNYTAVTALTKGQLVAVNDVFGFPIKDLAIGETGIIITKCEAKAKKNETVAIPSGSAVYYNSANSNIDLTATGDLVGASRDSSLAADTHVVINFDGFSAFLKA